MDPRADRDRRETVREQDHLLEREPEAIGEMPDEGVDIADDIGQFARRAALARRASVPARVPGEDGHILQP